MDDWPRVALEPDTKPLPREGERSGGSAGFACVWPYHGALDAAAAVGLAEDGANLYRHPGPVTLAGTSYEAAFVAPVDENDESIHDLVRAVVEDVPVRIEAVSTGHAAAGSDLGSGVLRPVGKPAVAVLTRDGTDTTARGSFNFFFDQMYRLPFTPKTMEELTEADLRRYNTIIIPDGGQSIGPGGIRRKPIGRARGRERGWK